MGIHDWDMRQPHETPARLASTIVMALLSVIPEMQWQFLQQRYTPELDGVYALRVGGHSWGFTVQGQTVTQHATAPTACDTTLSTDAENMILLTVGRADRAARLQSAALTMTGNAEKGQQLCATLFRSL
jgi:predicted lipid carrier protein YhbT